MEDRIVKVLSGESIWKIWAIERNSGTGEECHRIGSQCQVVPRLWRILEADFKLSAMKGQKGKRGQAGNAWFNSPQPLSRHQTCSLQLGSFPPIGKFFHSATVGRWVSLLFLAYFHLILSSFGPQTFTEHLPDQGTVLGTPSTNIFLLLAGFESYQHPFSIQTLSLHHGLNCVPP